MASESGGSILGGLVKVTGPEAGLNDALKPLFSGERSQANTRENLIQYGGPLGAAIVGEQQAIRAAGKAAQEWARENRRRAKRGLPELPRPSIADYQHGGVLARAGVMYQTAPAQPATQAPQSSVGGFLAGIDWNRAISTGAKIAELIAYFRELWSKGGSGDAGVTYTIPGGELAPSPFPTSIGGSNVPYNFLPSGAMTGDGMLGGAGALASGIGSIISAIRGGQNGSMPGGAMALGNYSGVMQTTSARGVVENFLGSGNTATCRIGGVVGINDPNSGRTVWFRRAGVPVLWSGDKAAAKRWNKGRGRRRSGGC